MPASAVSEVPTLATASTPAESSSKRTVKGVRARKDTKDTGNATTKKGGKKADGTTIKKRGRRVQPPIDASLKWQPEHSIFDVIPEHEWDNFMASTRKAWLETPDQGIDVGDYRSRVVSKNLLSLAILTWTDPRGVMTTVIREQISASGETHTTLDQSPLAQRVELAVDEGMASDPMRTQPPRHLVMFRMAQIMLKPDSRQKDKTVLEAYKAGKCGQANKEKHKFSNAYYEALDGLWRKHDTWPAVQAEYDARSTEVNKAMGTIAGTWKPRTAMKRSQYEQFDRDEVAAADPSILIPVPDDVIHILTDCNGQVLSFRWPKALQWFFGDDFVEKTAEHIEVYAQHRRPKYPDRGRHAMNAYWCRKHPEFQQKKRNQRVKLGVFHFGCGGVEGHKDKPPMTKPDSRDDKFKPEVIRLREEMMREGVMPWITKAHKIVQGILDPGLLAAQMEIMQHYDAELTRPTMEGDPFPLCAILVNPLTTDHRDQSDLKNGFALMCSVGDFAGGDLCCRQFAQRVNFEAGTITAIRGAEVYHGTTEWVGKNRYSIVHTCGEHLRQYAKIMDKKSTGERNGPEQMDLDVEEQGRDEEGNESKEEARERDQTSEDDDERYEEEDQDEEEEAAGTGQNPIEILATPEEYSSEEEEEGWKDEEEAAGTQQNPIEISETPSPVSKKRKRDRMG